MFGGQRTAFRVARAFATVATVVGVSAGVSASGCSSGDSPPAARMDEEVTFEVLYVGSDTSNALRGRQRLAALPSQLAQTETRADVLCLQGIGAPADRATLRSVLATVYPVSLELATDDATAVTDPRDATGGVPAPEQKAPCSGVEMSMARVLSCLTRCLSPGTTVIDSDGCVDDGVCAPDALFAADPERRCRSCITGHARTASSLTEINARCAKQSHPLVLHGDHGMMILSRFPLSHASIQVLPSEGTRRAVIGATATTPQGTQVDVFCATLGPTQVSSLPTDPRVGEPYPGPYGGPQDGWLRENELQVEKLGAHVAAQRGTRPAVVLGNFGVSAAVSRRGAVVLPATGPISAMRLEQLFTSGIATSYVPGCTVCSDNPLTYSATPTFENRIYLAGLGADAVRASVRTYEGAVVAPDPNGDPNPVPVSMQFGFQSRIAIPSR